jgi:hypothetical protein
VRPRAPRAKDRYRVGRDLDRTLTRIGELEQRIATTQAETLAGAAVQLRRLGAMLDANGSEGVRLLLASISGVVEALYEQARASAA